MNKKKEPHPPDEPRSAGLDPGDALPSPETVSPRKASFADNRVPPLDADDGGNEERTGPRSRVSGTMRSLGQSLPTVLVLVALAALGYGGHRAGWELPSFSQLTGQGSSVRPDWCAEHNVPESICIACNARLMPKAKLYHWCDEHGVSECALDHPELAQIVHVPETLTGDLEGARRALELKPRPHNDPKCKLHLRRVQFASFEAAEKAGIAVAKVDRRRVTEVVNANGQVQYDPTRLARLSSRASGTVWRVEKLVGDRVHRGDLLALIDAAEVGQAKAELLQAAAQLDLQEKTLGRLAALDGVVAGRRLQEAETAHVEAQAAVHRAEQALFNLGLPTSLLELQGLRGTELVERLHLLGLPPALFRGLDASRISANLLPIIASQDGVVVERDVVAGEVIETARPLFTVVDMTNMWLMLDVPVEEVGYVSLGHSVLFRPDGDSHDHAGRVTWLSTDVDAETRTVKVRAELPNPDGHLRNESFGAGRIVLRDEAAAIVVPREAVHWEGCCHVVFVRDKNFMQGGSYKVFHTRMIRPGVTQDDYIEAIAGLLPGEIVATTGSAILRAELLKGNLGAG